MEEITEVQLTDLEGEPFTKLVPTIQKQLGRGCTKLLHTSFSSRAQKGLSTPRSDSKSYVSMIEAKLDGTYYMPSLLSFRRAALSGFISISCCMSFVRTLNTAWRSPFSLLQVAPESVSLLPECCSNNFSSMKHNMAHILLTS
nr:hypothetical protein Iba_scaffold830823CG0010 [Ipomoea batatas]GME14106.1 hypothetical protein Iba_scaffold14936CG0150 [Ipomoea batatas]